MFPVAIELPLTIEKGATFDPIVILSIDDEPIDLTGCEARHTIKPAYDSAVTYEDFTTQAGTLEIDAADGKILYHVTDEDTALMDWREGVHALYVFFPDGKTRCMLKGPAYVFPGTF